jgi:hypothetical protein
MESNLSFVFIAVVQQLKENSQLAINCTLKQECETVSWQGHQASKFTVIVVFLNKRMARRTR